MLYLAWIGLVREVNIVSIQLIYWHGMMMVPALQEQLVPAFQEQLAVLLLSCSSAARFLIASSAAR